MAHREASRRLDATLPRARSAAPAIRRRQQDATPEVIPGITDGKDVAVPAQAVDRKASEIQSHIRRARSWKSGIQAARSLSMRHDELLIEEEIATARSLAP